jgi:GH35 family endo-1,4-beta-xylanase
MKHWPIDHREGVLELTVIGPDGAPLVDREITVEQTRHDFAFGNIGFDLVAYANGQERLDHLAADYVELFNWATLPFYLGQFEPSRGHPDTARMLVAARWFAERGIRLKGHPLVWHSVKAPWLDGLPLDEIESVIRSRVRRDVGDFAGLIDSWDAINEVVIMPVFENEPDGMPNAVTRLAAEIGRVAMVGVAVDEARETNVAATLLLNDFDLSTKYEELIDRVLDAGIGIDAIGLQTHMHQGYWGEEVMLEMVDRFAKFGLPLHLTESTLLSGHLMPRDIVDLNDYQPLQWPSTPEGEARQADEIVRHYRSLVSHPAVEAITYWGITDRGAWLGAPSGLLRTDGSRKPAYDALHALIKGEWWMRPTVLRTDAAGRVRISGFLGDYRVASRGASAVFRIGATGEGVASVRL